MVFRLLNFFIGCYYSINYATIYFKIEKALHSCSIDFAFKEKECDIITPKECRILAHFVKNPIGYTSLMASFNNLSKALKIPKVHRKR
jgi:hypothetical protein